MNSKAINIEKLNIEVDDKIPPKKKKSKVKRAIRNFWDDTTNNISYYGWRNPKRIVYNFIYFFKVVYKYRDFDYTYNFDLFIHSLERTAKAIDKHEIIVDHKETANSITEFIRLYKKQVEDDYFEEAGGDYTKVGFNFEPMESKTNDYGEPYYEMKQKVGSEYYTAEEKEEIHKQADILRKKDELALVEAFKLYATWWD